MIRPRKFRTRQARKRERVRVAVISVLSVMGIMGVIVLGGWGLRSDKLRIETVLVESPGVLQSDEVQAAIAQAFENSHAFFIPNDSILLSGIDNVREELLIRFPRMESVELRRAGMRTLTATVHERTSHALWCGDIVPEIAYSTSQKQRTAGEEAWGACYLMDDDSFIYAKAPIFTGDVFMRYYGPLDTATPIGQNFLTHDEFMAWQGFLAGLSEDGLVTRALLIVDERDVEIYLDNGLRVLIPRTEDFETLRNRLYSTMEEGAIDTSRNIEYVDLRFGTKAFVRYVEIPQETQE